MHDVYAQLTAKGIIGKNSFSEYPKWIKNPSSDDPNDKVLVKNQVEELKLHAFTPNNIPADPAKVEKDELAKALALAEAARQKAEQELEELRAAVKSTMAARQGAHDSEVDEDAVPAPKVTQNPNTVSGKK